MLVGLGEEGFLGDFEYDSASDACDETDDLVDLWQNLCNSVGCDADSKDCERTCSKVAQSCTKETKADLTEDLSDRAAEAKVLMEACKVAADPKDCKGGIKGELKEFKKDVQDAKKETKGSCKDSDVVQACEDFCNDVLGDGGIGEYSDFIDCGDLED